MTISQIRKVQNIRSSLETSRKR